MHRKFNKKPTKRSSGYKAYTVKKPMPAFPEKEK